MRVPGAAGTEVSLEQPGSPLQGGLVFVTDDVRALYDALKSRGVTDFTQEPTEHFYGTDMGIRDPFGNPIRILQQGGPAQKATV